MPTAHVYYTQEEYNTIKKASDKARRTLCNLISTGGLRLANEILEYEDHV